MRAGGETEYVHFISDSSFGWHIYVTVLYWINIGPEPESILLLLLLLLRAAYVHGIYAWHVRYHGRSSRGARHVGHVVTT